MICYSDLDTSKFIIKVMQCVIFHGRRWFILAHVEISRSEVVTEEELIALMHNDEYFIFGANIDSDGRVKMFNESYEVELNKEKDFKLMVTVIRYTDKDSVLVDSNIKLKDRGNRKYSKADKFEDIFEFSAGINQTMNNGKSELASIAIDNAIYYDGKFMEKFNRQFSILGIDGVKVNAYNELTLSNINCNVFTVPEGVVQVKIGDEINIGELILPDSCKIIGCEKPGKVSVNIDNIRLNKVKYIASGAFENCKIERMHIENKLYSISAMGMAFKCTELTGKILCDNIADYAFYECWCPKVDLSECKVDLLMSNTFTRSMIHELILPDSLTKIHKDLVKRGSMDFIKHRGTIEEILGDSEQLDYGFAGTFMTPNKLDKSVEEGLVFYGYAIKYGEV